MNKNNIVSCPSCASKKIVRTGKRKNKNRIIQRYLCKKCRETFSLNPIKNKTYPVKIILNTISFYNLGHPQEEVIKLISRKHKTKVPQRTISNWINNYKSICTFARLRNKAIKQFNPKNIIQKQTLSHIQPYTFQYHKAKLNILLEQNPQFIKLKDYLEKINSKGFPHHIFTYPKNNNSNNQRASKIKFKHLKITHIKKQNLANKLTSLALNLAKTNKDRHNAVQNFMLINDSTTIATEIPVYLTKDDITYFISRGFQPGLVNQKTPITGHIDLLQIRNGLIHILDYKPESNKISPINQLTIYALALASKTKLPLSQFKCAWFDENNYFEFHRNAKHF